MPFELFITLYIWAALALFAWGADADITERFTKED